MVLICQKKYCASDRYVSSEPSLSTVEEENNRWRNIHITEEWNEYT